jgi:hypothetical protein
VNWKFVHKVSGFPELAESGQIEIGLFSEQCPAARRIPDLKTLGRKYKRGTCDINRHRPDTGRLTAKQQRHQFGYKKLNGRSKN